MEKKYTQAMVITAMFAQYRVNSTYVQMRDALEAAGNADADKILEQVWEDDMEWSPAQGRWNDSMAIRYATLSNAYNVKDRDLWDSTYTAANTARWRWDDFQQVQKLIRTCEWHLKRDEGVAQIRKWKEAKKEIEGYLDMMWEATVNLGPVSKLVSNAKTTMERTKKKVKQINEMPIAGYMNIN